MTKTVHGSFVTKNRPGNRNCIMLRYFIYLVGAFGMSFAQTNLALLVIAEFICGVGGNLAGGPNYSICADTVNVNGRESLYFKFYVHKNGKSLDDI